MTKRDDEQQEKLAKQYADGELPEGWALDPVSEMRGGPRFVRTDAGGTTTDQHPEGTRTPPDADVEP